MAPEAINSVLNYLSPILLFINMFCLLTFELFWERLFNLSGHLLAEVFVSVCSLALLMVVNISSSDIFDSFGDG